MERMSRLWAAIVTGFMATLLIPAVVWAEETGVAEELKKKKGLGGLSLIPALCCLVVVAIIVVAVLLVMKNRKK